MAIGRDGPSPRRDVVDHCWEDRWIEGDYNAELTDSDWRGPCYQEWTITVEALACAECFCSKCYRYDSCARKERDEEHFSGYMDTYDDDDGTWDLQGRFLIRPLDPVRRGICNTREDELGRIEKTCQCRKCIPWEPSTNPLTVKVYYDCATQPEGPSDDSVKAEVEQALAMESLYTDTPDILGDWVGCDCKEWSVVEK